jgi:Undecaprenyl-phosphate galactose phosphotransferase WbaP
LALNILLRDEGAQAQSERRIAVSERSAAVGLVVIDMALVVVAFLGLVLTGTETALGLTMVLGQLGCFILAKALLGLYPGHGMAGAERLRNIVLAIAAGLLVNAGLLILIMRSGIVLTDHAVVTLLLGAIGLAVSDPIGRRVLHRLHRWQEPVFIFGGGEAAAGLVRQLSLYPQLGFRAVCVVDDSSLYIADEHQGIPIIRFRELGMHSELLAITTTALVVEQLVERSFVQRLYTTGIFQRILLIPSCHDLISLNSKIRRVGSMLAIAAGSDRPSRVLALSKRAFDVMASAAALVILSPVLGLVAILVRQDSPGPALFSQPRWAGADRHFTVHKFRTMYLDGDRRLRRYFLSHPHAEREYARYRKLDHDPRVTRIGRLLRATSIDELPQLLNVLKGEMSIVGPRPYTMDEVSKLGPAAEILGLMPPGITGFWQVSGRNQRTFRERIEMDCYYVRNYSGWLDIWVIYRTIIAVLMREGK